jgi:hypothetical protein
MTTDIPLKKLTELFFLSAELHADNIELADESLPLLAIAHGIANLIYEQQQNKNNLTPNSLTTLQKHYTEYRIINSFVDSEAIKILEQLKALKIDVVVLKGFALSHQIYPSTFLRPKTDIDIIINPKDEEAISTFFQQQKYINPRGWKASAISNEFSMIKNISKGVCVNFDIHLKISNSKLIDNLLNYSELLRIADKTTLPNINLVSKPHALIHAVVHLLHHRASGDLIKLIWYYDIYLLIEKISQNEKTELQGLIQKKELVTVILECIKLTTVYFNSSKIEDLIAWCEQPNIKKKSNIKYQHLLRNTYGIKGLWLTLLNTTGLVNKWSVIRETAFPPKEEIYLKYGINNKTPIIFLYVKRIFFGVIKYITPKNK